MGDFAVSGQRGTTIGFQVTVELNGAAYDITAAGVTIAFSAKRKRSDVAPLIRKTYRAAPGVSDAGMSEVGAPAVKNVLQVELAPGDTDPTLYADGSFAATEFLVWDAILTEPTGRETAIAKGSLTVRAGVGS